MNITTAAENENGNEGMLITAYSDNAPCPLIMSIFYDFFNIHPFLIVFQSKMDPSNLKSVTNRENSAQGQTNRQTAR